ncbi:MAG: class I SAM-dependent rRNA methyltransferase [Polyangiaceae bacterium]
MAMARLKLPAKLEHALLAGHPWVYRDHVQHGFRAATGAWVEVECERFRGYALWDNEGPIALRIYSRKQAPDERWLNERVRQAHELRRGLLSANTTAYRWLFGEGDGLPGLVVDRYGDFNVVLSYAPSVSRLLAWLPAALEQVLPARGTLHKRGSELSLLSGELPPERVEVLENGLRFQVAIGEGQKSGLFLDQRENRAHVESLSAGKRVLNLFSYTGGFSLYAARGGAISVTSVDVSRGALEDAKASFELNKYPVENHEFIAQDVFEYLERTAAKGERFDLVICDPPAFAKNKEQLRKALRAYERVNRLALKVVEPGGLFASASCTSQVSPEAFRGVLAEASGRAKLRLQMIHEAGHAIDHPVMASHVEGRYLKYVVSRVLASA